MINSIIKKNRPKKWYNDRGELHREDGPARHWGDGHQEWWVNGSRHRTDGPAIIFINGAQQWWVNDKLHREDGPAYIGSDGTQAWYFNNCRITEETDIKLFTGKEDDLIILILKYGNPT